jgi:hypothetical protein
VAAGLSISALYQAWNAKVKLHEAREYLGLDEGETRSKLYGRATVEAYDALRDAIPADGTYLIADESGDGAELNPVRYDLAPRRPVLVYRRTAEGGNLLVPERPAGVDRLVLLRPGGKPPRLLDAASYYRVVHPGREDGQIPSNLDVPAAGHEIHGPLVLGGWCQEPGERPCEAVAFLLDGEVRVPDLLERVPRPDVSAVLASIGPAPRAGFVARFAAGGDVVDGEHEVTALVTTADGRFRRLGPRKIRWYAR